MKTKKMNVSASVKLKAYDVIADAVADGIEGGWNKAHKHTQTPSPEEVKEKIHDYVMLSLTEIINFE